MIVAIPVASETELLSLAQRIALMYQAGQPENSLSTRHCPPALITGGSVAVNPPLANMLHQL